MHARTIPIVIMLVCATCLAAHAAEEAEVIEVARDAVADEVLKSATDYLKSSKTLSVEASIYHEVFLTSGHKVEFERQVQVRLKRPNKIRAEVMTDVANRRVYYDGKVVTIYSEDHNVFTTIDAPGTIDEMADALYEKFDVALPLVDVLVNDPYASYDAKVTFSRYLGLHGVNGELCHHLMLSNAEIDYQIWIADGEQPQLRKIVIDYVHEPGVPQHSIRFGQWTRDEPANDTDFDFAAPEGATKIGILPVIVVAEEGSE